MKKLLALAMAAMMCAVTAPIHAADEATEVNPQTDENKNIESETDTQAANGEVWAMLTSDTKLDQMKVTVPIRLHFAVLNKETGAAADAPLQFKAPHKDKYAIAVDKDSSVGVKVTAVKFEKPLNGAWTLADDDTAAQAITDNPKTVAIKLNNKWMKLGDNTFEAAEQLKIAPNSSKSLVLDGSASKSTIPEKTKGIYEKAFNVTYTLEMDKADPTPAP